MSEYFEGVFIAIIKAPMGIALLFCDDIPIATKLGVLTIWPGVFFAWIAWMGVMA